MALYNQVIQRLKSKKDPKNIEGMKRFGINTKGTLGISVAALREMAREIGKDHELAGRLWRSRIHEARILASMIDDPDKVAESQLDRWAGDFDSWDVCDQCCSNLFARTRYAYRKASRWSREDGEFVKRAGYAMMAALAVHDKKSGDDRFVPFFPLIKYGSRDERNFVKKAVNWALRQMGKRSRKLNALAIRTAREIQKMDSRSARWVAADAIRELESKEVQSRLD
ncbi:MAG: DNA alkylation repair protein [Candidatus Micrarchaeota archaeon]|nr:DNA alkylation repair protein [Candidatus Micrarchaeota archaeon]